MQDKYIGFGANSLSRMQPTLYALAEHTTVLRAWWLSAPAIPALQGCEVNDYIIMAWKIEYTPPKKTGVTSSVFT